MDDTGTAPDDNGRPRQRRAVDSSAILQQLAASTDDPTTRMLGTMLAQRQATAARDDDDDDDDDDDAPEVLGPIITGRRRIMTAGRTGTSAPSWCLVILPRFSGRFSYAAGQALDQAA